MHHHQIEWKSIQANLFINSSFKPITLKYRIRAIRECTTTKSNGSQFRQIYSSLSLQTIHSQMQHKSSYGMHHHQIEVISNWANLFIISFFENHSSNPMKHNRKCDSLHPIHPFQSLPKKAHSQSHTRNNP